MRGGSPRRRASSPRRWRRPNGCLPREQHLSQLDGLAAAAAHELGTPLATIALVVKELHHSLPAGRGGGGGSAAPARTGRALPRHPHQAHLHGAGGFGVPRDHHAQPSGGGNRGAAAGARSRCRRSRPAARAPEPMVRRNPGVVYGLSNILDNAADFANSRVSIEAHWSDRDVVIEIRDDGPGYAPDILLRVGEPYVTTRSAADRRRGQRGRRRPGPRPLHRQDPAGALGRATDPVQRGVIPKSGAVARIVWLRQAFERGAAISPQADRKGTLRGESNNSHMEDRAV